MPVASQIVITGQSKPGVLAQVVSVLAGAKVNIKAFSAPEVTGKGNLRLLVSDVDQARAALRAACKSPPAGTAIVRPVGAI